MSIASILSETPCKYNREMPYISLEKALEICRMAGKPAEAGHEIRGLRDRDLPDRDLPDRDLPDRDLPDREKPAGELPAFQGEYK